ncbi:LuxR family transcriptional regulator [Pseudomonas aeruginosa]|uniref:LuxR C-terminal-related transcriptional regulator n=1 Tax=Pseudomonas aeruginosa TaxID=287 RepID=UPI001067D87C|nr:helix-turn-helix transcriptional regulator [Pseudomonas aeruginosa]TEO04786.1 LuxR family transcriptional regulator [Pseudomonas aeruginosa]TEO06239.1 LuxR family transcriptional regulator [Pseudomonas aeruginosa]TEO11324.1 LuxR family transcriptional regulator [Pseudomonas aeruginosa]TEO24092.1 LuxR family transcriptional regulator [Pseudomonas aeruginosa]HCF3424638.1 helix-turn-helix transcriptional regulator [Pseudomonas aeruginosa]
MEISLKDIAWQRSLGNLLDHLDQPDFWLVLVETIREFVQVDNWVSLVFSDSTPVILFYAEEEEEEKDERKPNHLIGKYITGYYRIDPFYAASRSAPGPRTIYLRDIVTPAFNKSRYYIEYFETHVVCDEMQYNIPIDDRRTLCLSLGSEAKYTAENIAFLEIIRPWVLSLMSKRLHFEESLQDDSSPSLRVDSSVLNALVAPLTGRESQVLNLMLEGKSNKEIADKLAISVSTTKVHRRHVYAKLNVSSHSELFALLLKDMPSVGNIVSQT